MTLGEMPSRRLVRRCGDFPGRAQKVQDCLAAFFASILQQLNEHSLIRTTSDNIHVDGRKFGL